MRKNRFQFMLPLIVLVASCGKGTASDPKTEDKSDLNPPFNLMSITAGTVEKGEFVLQWDIANTEEDLAGYNVYIVPGGIDDLQKKLGASAKDYDLSTQQIRRCIGTSELFAHFGFDPKAKQAQKDCSDFIKKADLVGDASTATADAGTADEDTVASNTVMCKSNDGKYTPLGSNGLSYDIKNAADLVTGEVLTTPKQRVGKTLKCTVKNDATQKFSDKEKTELNFKIGTKYTAFVVAVAGEKKNKISYTSNFVEDIPAVYTKNDLVLLASKYKKAVIDFTKDLVWTQDNCEDDGMNKASACRVARNPSFITATAPTIALLEDVQANSERTFLAGRGNLYISPRNARGMINGKAGIYEPGDKALKLDASTKDRQYITNQNFPIYPGAFFDLAYEKPDGIYYGKIYFEDIKSFQVGSPTTPSTDGLGTKTINYRISLSKAPNELFYFGPSQGYESLLTLKK